MNDASNPLVSVIIPTKNSSRTLEACLKSVKEQTYSNVELIVVDNFSDDNTEEIARKFTNQVYLSGPERSSQRNFGVAKSFGEYLLIVDSDMILSENVICACVKKVSDETIVGVIIPEESFGIGFWAQCKKLERSFYVGVDWMEAARFFRRDSYLQLGGYDEAMVSGEDWDLSQRVSSRGKITRISEYIYHNECKINLRKTLKKKFYYAKNFSSYEKSNIESENFTKQTSITGRYGLFFSKPWKLLHNPWLGLGMLFMKTSEFGFGGVGYLVSKINLRMQKTKNKV